MQVVNQQSLRGIKYVKTVKSVQILLLFIIGAFRWNISIFLLELIAVDKDSRFVGVLSKDIDFFVLVGLRRDYWLFSFIFFL